MLCHLFATVLPFACFKTPWLSYILIFASRKPTPLRSISLYHFIQLAKCIFELCGLELFYVSSLWFLLYYTFLKSTDLTYFVLYIFSALDIITANVQETELKQFKWQHFPIPPPLLLKAPSHLFFPRKIYQGDTYMQIFYFLMVFLIHICETMQEMELFLKMKVC